MTNIIINIIFRYINQLTNQPYVIFARFFRNVLDDICVLHRTGYRDGSTTAASIIYRSTMVVVYYTPDDMVSYV